MDSMGDADELGVDERRDATQEPVLTPETRAITAAGLVLLGFLSGAPLQLVQLLYYRDRVNSSSAALLWLVVPAGLMALAGVVLGLQTRRLPLTRNLRGLSGAATIIGSALVALYALVYLYLAMYPGS